jgi:steroid delta-isomerase
MPTTDHMKATVQAYAAAHTAKDADAIVALFAPDCVVADPVDRPEMVGRDAVREFFAGTHQVSEGFELMITGPIRAVDRFAGCLCGPRPRWAARRSRWTSSTCSPSTTTA